MHFIGRAQSRSILTEHKKHGEDALRGGLAAKTEDGAVRALQLEPKDRRAKRSDWKDQRHSRQ